MCLYTYSWPATFIFFAKRMYPDKEADHEACWKINWKAKFKALSGWKCSLQICVTAECEIVKSRLVLIRLLMLTMIFFVMLSAVFSVMFFVKFSAIFCCNCWCSCFCSSCVDSDIIDCFCCDDNESKRCLNALSNMYWIRIIKELTCFVEKSKNEIWLLKIMM